MMLRIFVCYPRVDLMYCTQLLPYLAPYHVWYDLHIKAGQDWWQEILKHIEWCDVFVLLVSPNTLSSKYCQEEYTIARAKGKRILPILIAPCDVPSDMLTKFYVDARAGLTVKALATLKDWLTATEHALYDKNKQYSTRLSVPTQLIQAYPNPVTFVPETVVEDVSAALERGDTDTALYLLEMAEAAGVTSPVVDLCQWLEDVRRSIDARAYKQRADQAYQQVKTLVKKRATFELGIKAFETFIQEFPDYDPDQLALYLSQRIAPSLLWCDIPEGEVTLEYEGKHRVVYHVDAFRISKYPITHAQFQKFIDAPDGYNEERWWLFSEEAKAWHRAYPKPLERHTPVGDYPRVNVSWYEAMAFCLWLSAKTGLTIRLPTEPQWQRAAQGDDGRRYPYGNTFSRDACNARQTRIRSITSVKMFPLGASPFQVMDMSGNCWEWTLSKNKRDADPNKRDFYLAKGGSCSSRAEAVRVTARAALAPDSRYGTLGFRVAVVGQ